MKKHALPFAPECQTCQVSPSKFLRFKPTNEIEIVHDWDHPDYYGLKIDHWTYKKAKEYVKKANAMIAAEDFTFPIRK